MVCSAEPVVDSPKLGRPTVRSQSLAEAICDLLAEGNSLRSICRDERMPGSTTVFRWLAEDEDFRQQYARAREVQADQLADEIIDIADQATSSVNASAVKVRVDARIWAMSKINKTKYGDKGSGDVHVSTTVNNLLVLTDQRQREIQEIRKGLLER